MNLNKLASEVARRAETKRINLDVTHVKNVLRHLSETLQGMDLQEAVDVVNLLFRKRKQRK